MLQKTRLPLWSAPVWSSLVMLVVGSNLDGLRLFEMYLVDNLHTVSDKCAELFFEAEIEAS